MLVTKKYSRAIRFREAIREDTWVAVIVKSSANDCYRDSGRINLSFIRQADPACVSVLQGSPEPWISDEPSELSRKSICSVASYNQGGLGKDYFYNTVFYTKQAEQTAR